MTPKELAEVEGKPIALAWIDVAVGLLREHLEWLLLLRGLESTSSGADAPARALVAAALSTNFSLDRAARSRVVEMTYVWRILGTFTRARAVIEESDRWFSNVAVDDARTLFPPGTPVPPAYAMYERGVFFTPLFAPYDSTTGRGFGPRCRAAMIVHESVHVIDAESGQPNVHISEWQEPMFSAQTPEESVHNPSAYASFAAQVHEGALDWPVTARYGAGRAAD